MKKSKLLQSSKDMLSRSFNPAKCKTSLRLAISRLKLMRNKKDAQVKQMKREISQLLESGQARTARIRVDHVVREEKLISAYDLLEIYCELIVARLPIIESQKNVPIDLKEAIASVIFASPRCGDVPELLDVRKHLTAKYGKDFTTAAIELRPDSGVGRMLVEKLSAVAPDGQTKLKILSAIAEEHNVKWDPNACTEKDYVPPNDLLNGPNSFEKTSTLYAEPPPVQASPVHATPSNDKIHTSLGNVLLQDPRTSSGPENLSFQDSGASRIQPTARPLGDSRAHYLSQDDSFRSSLDRHSWNMEFKDAASAAQAAAESAERASMAARAAAELSNREKLMRQSSSESHNSYGRVLKDEERETCGTPKSISEQVSENSVNVSSWEETRVQNVVKPGNEKKSQSFKKSRDDEKEHVQSTYHDVPAVGLHSQNLKVSRGEMSMKKPSSQFEGESSNYCPEKFENFREERFGKQPSGKSSLGDTKKYVEPPSKSKISKSESANSSISDDVNIFVDSDSRSFGIDASAGGGVHGERSQTSYHESSGAVFDKSDSDSDNGGPYVGTNNDGRGSSFLLRSQSPEHFSLNRNSLNSKTSSSNQATLSSSELFSNRKNSFPDRSENSIAEGGSELDTPVKFDYSDGPSSESDEEMDPNQRSNRRESDSSKFKEKGLSRISKKEQSSLSSDDELQFTEIPRRTRKGRTGSEENYNLGKSADHQPETRPEEFEVESDELDNKFSPEIEGLNFGKLTGGFRQKGYNRPQYLKNPQGGRSLSKKEAEEANASTIKSTFPSTDESPKIRTMLSSRKSSRAPVSHSDTDTDSFEEEESLPMRSGQMRSGQRKALFAPNAGGQVKAKTGLKAPNSVFDSDNSDLDEDVPKESHTKKSPMRSGISRRTKAPPSGSKPVSYTKMHRAEPETFDSERGSPVSEVSVIPLESDAQRKKSLGWENYERPTSAKVDSIPAKSSLWASPQQPPSEKVTHVPSYEPKPQLKTGDERKHVYKQRKESKALDYDRNEEPNPSTSSTNEALPQFEPKMNSKPGEKYKHPAPAKETGKPDRASLWAPPEQHKAGSKPNYLGKLETPEQPNPGKSTSMGPHKSKTSEQPSSAQTKTEEGSVSSQNPKVSTSNSFKSNNGDSPLKAGHVHPKLPDYDSLVQALRKNRP